MPAEYSSLISDEDPPENDSEILESIFADKITVEEVTEVTEIHCSSARCMC